MTRRQKAAGAAMLMCLSVCGFQVCARADSIIIAPRVLPVGQWAQGLVMAGGSMWVSEAGQGTIAQLDLARNGVARHITVGRLPGEMTLGGDGAIYAVVQTDKLIWQQFPQNAKGKSIGGVEGCPTAITSGGQHLWVLTDTKCGSTSSRVVRMDPRNGDRKTSGALATGGLDMLTLQGKVWIANFGNGQALSVVDEQTMAVSAPNIQGQFGAIAANGSTVYAGGMVNGTQAIVMSINPVTLQEERRQNVGERVLALAADDRSVVAVGQQKNIFVFSANGLELQRVITVSIGNFDPRSALLVGDDLYITNNKQQGDNGAVLILSGWRPAPLPVPTAKAAAPANDTDCPYQVVNVSSSSALWIYDDADTRAPKTVAILPDGRGIVADRCIKDWCHVTYRGASGWAERRNIRATCN